MTEHTNKRPERSVEGRADKRSDATYLYRCAESLSRLVRLGPGTPSGPDTTPGVLTHIQQHKGNGREDQEDSALALTLDCCRNGLPVLLRLSVIADGCGGANGGEVASALCCRDISRGILAHMEYLWTADGAMPTAADREKALVSGFAQANSAVLRAADENGRLVGMASTAVCLLIVGPTVSVAWAGDSRCYRYRDGTVTRLTTDHNKAQILVDEGIITPEEAQTHPARCHLTNALGAHDEVMPDIVHGATAPGDLYLLTTDGFHEGLSEESMAQFCRAHLTQPASLRDLRTLGHDMEVRSLEAYGHDNLTAILVYVGPRSFPGDTATRVYGFMEKASSTARR